MRIATLNGFKGLDERLKFDSKLETAASMKNLRVTDNGSLTKKPGSRLLFTADADNIEAIWSGSIGNVEKTVFSADGYIYTIAPNELDAVPEYIGRLGSGRCCMFEFDRCLYIITPTDYGKYDGRYLTKVEGYIPCIAMNCKPSGEGELYEQINLLTPKRRQLFSGDGTTILYYLAEKGIESIVDILIDGVRYGYRFSLDGTRGTLSLEKPPAAGINNVEVIYSMGRNDNERAMILGCGKAAVFGSNSDERVFLWGNDDYPNYRFHSDLASGIESAEYFPVNSYTVIGSNRINCIAQQYNKQLIFTADEAYYSCCELKNDSLGNTYASFPVYNLNGAKGCIIESDGCIVDNKPVTLCNDGLNMWESSSIENEKNAVCFSEKIAESLKNVLYNKEDVCFFDFQANRELYFVCGDTAYIYNYGNGSWYIYEDFEGKNFSVYGTMLYYSVGNALYAFGGGIENGFNEESVWESPFVTLGQSNGRSDIIGFEADLHIAGPVNIRFEFEKSGGDVTARDFCFGETESGFLRLSLRPAVKRAMPFKLRYIASGTGRSTLHAVTVITRERERSSRYGIQ